MTIDGLTTLRKLDPQAESLGASICRIASATGLQAHIDWTTETGGDWFLCAQDRAFRVISEGVDAPDAMDAAHAVAVLDGIDPLLTKIEAALGIDLDALRLDPLPDMACVIGNISDAHSRLHLAIPVNDVRSPDWMGAQPSSQPDAAQMPIVFSLGLAGPRLPVAQASALGVGDLLLIATRLRADIVASDVRIFGSFDLMTGTFTAAMEGGTMADSDEGAFDKARDFAVPVTIRLGERMTSAATLAALRPGVTLPLGPMTEGMPVTLLVADRPLARGELVQLGDRFAVLIEDRDAIEDPVQAPVDATGDPQ